MHLGRLVLLFAAVVLATSNVSPASDEVPLAQAPDSRRRLTCTWQSWAHKMVCKQPVSTVPAGVAAPAATAPVVAVHPSKSFALGQVAQWLYQHPPSSIIGSITSEEISIGDSLNSSAGLDDEASTATIDALISKAAAETMVNSTGIKSTLQNASSSFSPDASNASSSEGYVYSLPSLPACEVNKAALRARPQANPVCYVIPVHDPKFDTLNVFLESHAKHGHDTDSAVVFSAASSRAAFWRQHPAWSTLPEVRLLVFCGSQLWEANLKVHVVFYKKWWAVLALGRAYKYYVLVDAEVFVLQKFCVEDFATAFFAKKTIFGRNLAYNSGHVAQHLHTINKMSAWRFTGEERAGLNAATEHLAMYFWYNEVPIVETESALEYIRGFLFRPAPRTTLEFDWVSYAYFLIARHGFKVVDVDAVLRARGESSAFSSHFSLGEDGGGPKEVVALMQPHWATSCAWLRDRHKFNQSAVFLLFHMDRCPYAESLFRDPERSQLRFLLSSDDDQLH